MRGYLFFYYPQFKTSTACHTPQWCFAFLSQPWLVPAKKARKLTQGIGRQAPVRFLSLIVASRFLFRY